MLQTTLRAAWSRKRRLLGTALAVILGVAFLTATLTLGDSARAGFEAAFGEATAGTDAYVRAEQELTAAEAPVRPAIDAGVVDQVSGVDGIRTATPAVEGNAQVLDSDGEPIGGTGAPTVAAGWIEDPALTGWELTDGRAPERPGEVVVDRGSAETAGMSVGDAVRVLVPEPIDTTVVGIATFGDDDSIGGTTYVGFEMGAAQEVLLGSPDLISGVVVAGEDGLSEDELVHRLRPVLPDGVEAITGDALAQEMEEGVEGDFLSIFTTALLSFALVALAVAAFTIFNTMSILAAQHTRESALLRALGASRRQVLVSAVLESTIVGLSGAAIGAGTGILVAMGMLAVMEHAGFGLPTDGVAVSASALLAAVAAGLVVTVIGGLVPAWRSSRVAPLAALREVAVDQSAASRPRAIAGLLTTAVGAVVVATPSETLGRLALGAFMFLAGLIMLGPVVARPVGQVLGAPLRWRGVSGDLAGRNAVRNPRRTAATATALLLGVGVVSLFTVFGASVSETIEDQVDRSFGGDLVLMPTGAGWSGAGLSPDVIRHVRELPETEAVAGLGYGPGMLDGRQQSIGFTDPAQLDAVAEFEMVAGDIADVGDDDIALSAEYAESHGYRIGDPVEIGFPDGESETVTLAATYDDDGIGGQVLVTETLWSQHTNQPTYYLTMISLADGVGIDDGRAAVDEATAGAGAPDVMDRDEYIEQQAAQIDALLTLVYALLAVAIVIALMGIANTLSLSVHERTRELGLLRAVGQTRAELRAMVRWESVIVATFGSVGGLGLGMFLSWGIVRSHNAEAGFGTYAVPFDSLAAILVIGAVVGILAGVRPARRASRLDVLAAVAVD